MYVPSDRIEMSKALRTIYSAQTVHLGIHRVAPHRLATVLLAFALALKFSSSVAALSPAYLFSAASALLTTPKMHFMVEHSLASVECLHMMVSFLFTTGDSTSAKAAWIVLGLAIRLAFAMGLHRDSSKWGVVAGPAKREKDRLWWELMTYDML